ncbi:hypothetical protein [Dactylosporangium sp. CA-139066]|uniref:hypothetical protein n=1 Tax=Dactylosporangium sp. CA-139066 TaxID=3239930 RepID=UPI003D9012F2
MRLKSTILVFLLSVPLAACTTSSVNTKCSGGSCTLTVKTTSSTKTDLSLFKPARTVYFSNLRDGGLDVRESGTTRTIEAGAESDVGRIHVKVTSAKAGEAHLVVTRS